METKRRGRPLPLGSAAGRTFRRLLYGAIGVVLSSYVVLFILVVSRHIDRGAREEMGRSLAEDPPHPANLLGMDRFHEKWAAVARVLATGESRAPPRARRRIHACTQPRLRKPPGPPTALASFPGSGNTWVRFLVQQATGLLTGSVYRDYSLKRNGFPAESIANGSVLLVKTHEWGQAARAAFQKAVLLVRDPYGALAAEFNRRAGGHVGHASPDKFRKGNAWPNFVLSHAKLWMESILDWLHFEGPLLVLRYEAMSVDLAAELVRLLKFLEANVSWSAFRCVLRNRDGIFRRARRHLDFEPFDGTLRRVVDRYKAVVERALRHHERGLPFDPGNVTVAQSHETNTSSSYVEKDNTVTYVEKDDPS